MENYLKNTLATESQKQRREAQYQLAEEVARLLMNHKEREGLHWKGTMTDLMEALHMTYETGRLTNDEGICVSFLSIVRYVCLLLHVNIPYNPYELAARGTRRKGRQMTSYLDRYLYRMKRSREGLWHEIEGPTGI